MIGIMLQTGIRTWAYANPLAADGKITNSAIRICYAETRTSAMFSIPK